MKLRSVSIFKPKRRNRKHHPWMIAFGTGENRQVVSGSTDYGDTVAYAEKLSRLSQRVDLGLADKSELRQAVQRNRRLTDHLNEYERHLIASGKTTKHAEQLRLYAEAALEDATTVDEIVGSNVQARIAKEKARNRRIYAVENFLRWGAGDTRWPRSVAEDPWRMLKADLETAGIPRKTPEGIFDFHSFRHQCATNLISAGTKARSVQSHMRHGSVNLTFDTYGHLFDRDRRKVVQVLQRHDKRAGDENTEQKAAREWSHGESNPDLLNAIQNIDAVISIEANELRDKRNRRVAPRRAQRLLRRLHDRVLAAKRRAGGGAC